MPTNKYIIPDLEEALTETLAAAFTTLTDELADVLKSAKAAQYAWEHNDDDVGYWIDGVIEALNSIIEV